MVTEETTVRRPRFGPRVSAGLTHVLSLALHEFQDKQEGVFSRSTGFNGDRANVKKALVYLGKLIEWYDQKLTPDRKTGVPDENGPGGPV